MSRLARVVREFLGYRIEQPGVVAVSGGADSVALLRALHAAGCENLTVAHLNHHLRGNESNADEAFVCGLAASLELSFRSQSIDLAKEAEGENLEATARRVRYEFLKDVAEEVGAWIATGHTADDQAETVLHRLLRGTGLQGLRGIASIRAGGVSPPWITLHGGLTPPARLVVRPLLSISRAEVIEYLASLPQSYRTDSSNADSRFTRNRIRAELLPLLKSFNPEVVPTLGRLAKQADEAHRFIVQHAQELLQRVEKPRAGDLIVLDRRELEAAPPLLRREMLRLIWEREQWPMGAMGFDDWERAAELKGGNFPGGVMMHVRERVVQIG